MAYFNASDDALARTGKMIGDGLAIAIVIGVLALILTQLS